MKTGVLNSGSEVPSSVYQRISTMVVQKTLTGISSRPRMRTRHSFSGGAAASGPVSGCASVGEVFAFNAISVYFGACR